MANPNTVSYDFLLSDPKKHSIRATCTSDPKLPDIYVPTRVLLALGAKADDTITVTYALASARE